MPASPSRAVGRHASFVIVWFTESTALSAYYGMLLLRQFRAARVGGTNVPTRWRIASDLKYILDIQNYGYSSTLHCGSCRKPRFTLYRSLESRRKIWCHAPLCVHGVGGRSVSVHPETFHCGSAATAPIHHNSQAILYRS